MMWIVPAMRVLAEASMGVDSSPPDHSLVNEVIPTMIGSGVVILVAGCVVILVGLGLLYIAFRLASAAIVKSIRKGR